MIAQTAPINPAEWTSLGLLAAVLVAVGAFLRWYLPARDREFEEALALQRQDALAARSEERAAFHEALEKQQQVFVTQIEREREILLNVLASEREHARATAMQLTAAIAEVRDALRKLCADVQVLQQEKGAV